MAKKTTTPKATKSTTTPKPKAEPKAAPLDPIEEIQKILFPNNPKEWDGVWGPKSQAALDKLLSGDEESWNSATATSFADPDDIAAFKKCKADGGYFSKGEWHAGTSDMHCFQIGDNGIGCWGDSTVKGSGPACALPSKIWEPYGHKARKKLVIVRKGAKEVTCELRDTSGSRNVIDLNWDACEALGLKPPIKTPVLWRFA